MRVATRRMTTNSFSVVIILCAIDYMLALIYLNSPSMRGYIGRGSAFQPTVSRF
jgi:hypothetical protein